jgi:hypothetical protein
MGRRHTISTHRFIWSARKAQRHYERLQEHARERCEDARHALLELKLTTMDEIRVEKARRERAHWIVVSMPPRA